MCVCVCVCVCQGTVGVSAFPPPYSTRYRIARDYAMAAVTGAVTVNAGRRLTPSMTYASLLEHAAEAPACDASKQSHGVAAGDLIYNLDMYAIRPDSTPTLKALTSMSSLIM